MSGILLGLFECVGKTHKVNKKGQNKWSVKFEDEYDNKITLAVDEATFERFSVGDQLPWKIISRQSTLTEAQP